MDEDIHTKLSLVSNNVNKLNEIKEQLNYIIEITDDIYDIKNIANKLLICSQHLSKSCRELYDTIDHEIVKKCDHEYIVDSIYCDPCKTYWICKNCKNIR